MYPATAVRNVDPVSTPRHELQTLLHNNAYRIADLLSQLEQSSAELRRLRSRASRARRGARKPSARSPRCSPRSTSTPSSSTSPCGEAARGHWSVDEEARFAKALAKHGPTAYSAITLEVGTRTEKQVRDHAWRVRQKTKAAEFAALHIPTPPDIAPAPDIAPSSTPPASDTTSSSPRSTLGTASPSLPPPQSPPLSAVSDDLSMLRDDPVLDALWEQASCEVAWNSAGVGFEPKGTGHDELCNFADGFLLLGDHL